MKTIVKKTWLKLLLCIYFILFASTTKAQILDSIYSNQIHEITIYVIPPAKPLDWDSPCSLYKTVFKSFVSTITKPKNPFMGHVFIKFSSSFLDETLYAGMSYKDKNEQREYLFKDKIGLGILGVPLKGRLENPNDLMYYLDYHAKQKDLAFVRFEIGDHAARDVIDFFHQFTTPFNGNNAPCDFYGGIFWPRYEHEGAGCTAFAISMLDVAGIRGEEINSWKRTINIPKDLIGGEFNDNNKVKCKQIKKHNSWASESESEDTYVAFEIYDPQLIYEWIISQRNLSKNLRQPGYLPVEEANIPGFISDRRVLKIAIDEPLFRTRPDDNLFIKHFYQKIEMSNVNSTK